MKFDLVYALPVLALVLAASYPLLKYDPNAPKSFKSRRRRRNLLGRLTVVTLLVSTVLAFLIPFPGLSNLLKALLLCAIVLIPAVLVHGYMTLRYGSLHKKDVVIASANNDAENALEQSVPTPESVGVEQSAPAASNVQLNAAETSEPTAKTTEDLPPINLFADSDKPTDDTTADAAAPSLLLKQRPPKPASTPHSSEGSGSPAQVQEQLDRVSDLIESHDLGNTDYSLSDEDLEQKRFSHDTHDVPLAIDTALSTIDSSTTELSKMTTTQISELVTNLRTDKTRLQKLVIAQQASIESERKSHDQSRTVARDAIKIMRDARNGQKFAEK
ncbi:MAG: hypothetical protein AB8B79_08360, partial [Granulosicoccus sp.]